MMGKLMLLVLAATLCGCSFAPVQPWEKGNLAKPVMALDPDPLEAKIDLHVYNSKEAAGGGYGIGGGGCGCN